MSVQTIYGPVQTLADFNGDRTAWAYYLHGLSQNAAQEWGRTIWFDGVNPTPEMVTARDTARAKADFFSYLYSNALFGDMVIPANILIPPALDTPPPPLNIVNNVIPSALNPSQTPQQGLPGIQTGGNGQTTMRYRFFIESTTPYHRFDTGANVATCSRANPNGCDPMQFKDLGALLTYAREHGETVVRVTSLDEAFNIIEGKTTVNPSQVVTGTSQGSSFMSALPLLGLAYTVYKSFK